MIGKNSEQGHFTLFYLQILLAKALKEEFDMKVISSSFKH